MSRFGDRKGFLEKNNPDVQAAAARNPDRCFFGTAPTLGELNAAFGRQTAAMWLTAQLYDLSEYCGCKDKLTGRQLEQCAELTAALYHWLKTSELMLFFARFKAGTYGRFYGSIDPMVIMSSLRIFIGEDRSNAIDRHESRLREQEREQWEREHQARLSSAEQQESTTSKN